MIYPYLRQLIDKKDSGQKEFDIVVKTWFEK
jgi:hypothetical protein